MSAGEEESAKLNYNKLFEHDRRADGALFVLPGTCLYGYRISQIMYRLLLLALLFGFSFRRRIYAHRGRPPLPVERRPSSLVCAWFNPYCWREKGSKLLARGALGPFALSVGSFSPRAPETVQMEHRMAWRIWCVPNQTTNPGHFWDCWSRGQKVSLLLGSARLDRRLS